MNVHVLSHLFSFYSKISPAFVITVFDTYFANEWVSGSGQRILVGINSSEIQRPARSGSEIMYKFTKKI